jgi:hypothetical protein
VDYSKPLCQKKVISKDIIKHFYSAGYIFFPFDSFHRNDRPAIFKYMLYSIKKKTHWIGENPMREYAEQQKDPKGDSFGSQRLI